MQALFALMLTVLALPALANGQKTADQHASVFIFMDTNYGAVVSRYNLKVAGVEMPPMHGYKYVGLSLPPGQHLIESERDGVGGTTVNLKVGKGEKHYSFIDPVGFPRPKPILTVVSEKRGLEGLGKSEPLPIPEKSLARLAVNGIAVASAPTSAAAATAQAPAPAAAAAAVPTVATPTPATPSPANASATASAVQTTPTAPSSESLRQQKEIEQLRAAVEEARLKQATAERLRAEAEEAKKQLAAAQENSKRISETNAPLVVSASQSTSPQPPQAQAIASGNRRALVIGNDRYKSVPQLANAGEDASTIAATLGNLGYQVTLRLDLDERGMKAILRTFSSQVQGGDEVLFFFAGHGVQLGAANYLLPVDIGNDSEAQVRDEAIQLQRILDDFSDRKAKFTLALLDACRDNPFKSLGRSIGGRGLAPTTAATGQMVIFSAGTGQQAMDKLSPADPDKNGLFTRVFVKEMQKSGLSIDRVMKNVRNEVAQMARTVGHEQVPAIYDQVLGDFYFTR